MANNRSNYDGKVRLATMCSNLVPCLLSCRRLVENLRKCAYKGPANAGRVPAGCDCVPRGRIQTKLVVLHRYAHEQPCPAEAYSSSAHALHVSPHGSARLHTPAPACCQHLPLAGTCCFMLPLVASCCFLLLLAAAISAAASAASLLLLASGACYLLPPAC